MDQIVQWIKDYPMQAAVVGVAALILVIALVVIIVNAIKGSGKKGNKYVSVDDYAEKVDDEEPENGANYETEEQPSEAQESNAYAEETAKETEDGEEVTVEETDEEPVKEETEEKTEETSEEKSEEKPEEKPEETEVKAEKEEAAEEKPAEEKPTEEKKPEAKTAKKEKPAAKEVNKAETEEKKSLGKWIVKEKGEKEYVAFLYANNGQIILTSETYSTADGAKAGIQTIQKNVLNDNFQLYCDKNRHYYFKVKTSQNRFLCAGETYSTKKSCENAKDSVKRFVSSPVNEEVEQDLTVIRYEVPANDEEPKARKGFEGKWLINGIDDMFMAQLYASNGQLLLSSEAYTSYEGAKSAINNIKSNGISGNFIIDSDKSGRFFFKLRNAQKSTLCVGETYAELSSCQSAIESVRRFLKTAKLVETEETAE